MDTRGGNFRVAHFERKADWSTFDNGCFGRRTEIEVSSLSTYQSLATPISFSISERPALGLTPADDPLIEAGNLSEQTEPPQTRIHAMYVDKLDGRVDAAFYDRMSAEWRREQAECLRQIERLNAADRSYLEDGIRILELAKNARSLFEWQEAREKRRLLDLMLSNSVWKEGRLHATLKQPFDMIAKTTEAAELAKATGRSEPVNIEIWLGD